MQKFSTSEQRRIYILEIFAEANHHDDQMSDRRAYRVLVRRREGKRAVEWANHFINTLADRARRGKVRVANDTWLKSLPRPVKPPRFGGSCGAA